MNKTIIGSLAALVLVAFGFVYFQPSTQPTPVNFPVGAASGPDHYEHEYFLQGATIGGNVFATSSQGTATYVASTLRNTRLIQHTAGAALTATLPASSTLTWFVPKAGDSSTIFLNPITTGITLAGGTGTDLNTASSTKFCVAGQLCRLDFTRKSNTDIEVLLTNSSGN